MYENKLKKNIKDMKRIGYHTLNLIVFYKNGLPRVIDTKESWLAGNYKNVYPKWWDGFIFVDVPVQSWDEGLITVDNVEGYK